MLPFNKIKRSSIINSPFKDEQKANCGVHLKCIAARLVLVLFGMVTIKSAGTQLIHFKKLFHYFEALFHYTDSWDINIFGLATEAFNLFRLIMFGLCFFFHQQKTEVIQDSHSSVFLLLFLWKPINWNFELWKHFNLNKNIIWKLVCLIWTSSENPCINQKP